MPRLQTQHTKFSTKLQRKWELTKEKRNSKYILLDCLWVKQRIGSSILYKRKKLHVILVIDEIDSLVDKNGDDILYNFTRANERMYEGGFIS